MKLAIFPDKVQPFYGQLDHELVVFEPVKFIVAYNYDRDGEVRLTQAWNWYRNFHFSIDDRTGTTGNENNRCQNENSSHLRPSRIF